MTKTFSVWRQDNYVVEVEAETAEEALEKCESEDKYLNGGSYHGSDFDLFDEEE